MGWAGVGHVVVVVRVRGSLQRINFYILLSGKDKCVCVCIYTAVGTIFALHTIRLVADGSSETSTMSLSQQSICIISSLLLNSVSLCFSKLSCKQGHSGPTYESMQAVFDLQSFRPAVNLSNPTITNISFTLYAVLGVNEKTQILTTFLWLRLYWHHEFLVWDPDECDGVTRISLPVSRLWSPDIIVYEFVDDDVSQACPYVYLNYTGRIRWDRMLRLVSACNLEIFSFPFDVQNCTFTFGSYMHTIKDLRVSPALTFKEMSENSKRYLEASGEWELVDILGETSILQFGVDELDIITFWVVIKRRPILYVVNLLIPSSFLMLIDILSFYLPPHSVDRATFKMTLILGYTVFLLIMNNLLPSTANGTPIIGIYFSVCLALMVISLLETVVITNVLHHSSMKYQEVPHWGRGSSNQQARHLPNTQPALEVIKQTQMTNITLPTGAAQWPDLENTGGYI
ncbi:5-hydroxytryptamine receptor 3C-like isoform X6 [Micropterus dolomieu]|uniref:5-hydroxytryptamine receptor 3C-like isoform X6 n=1 Tax=Micropterus dolomieu TaxID=147949 RepID=UPI001E8CF339|nr:5-hydroxytryptamine receptor 3C-like isoform X6 [Micropterus dolomieu]